MKARLDSAVSTFASLGMVLVLLWWAAGTGRAQVGGAELARGPMTGDQRNPALATHALTGLTLCVWDDKGLDAYGAENIRGRLLNQGGGFTGPLFDICVAAGEQKRPAPVAIDDGFLIFWEDRRNTSASKGQRDIYAAHLDVGGTASPRVGIPVSTLLEDESDVEAAASAAGVLVVWERAGLEPGIFARRMDRQGKFLDAEDFRLSSGIDTEPTVSAGPDGFLVIWESASGTRTVQGRMVSWSGAGAVMLGAELEMDQYLNAGAEADLFWTGSEFLVTWAYRGADNNPATIVGRRLRADGTSMDALPVTLASGVLAKETGLLQADGCTWLLTVPARPAARVLEARRICYGSVLDIGVPFRVSVEGELPQDVVTAGIGGWIAWEDQRAKSSEAAEDIYVRQFFPGRAMAVQPSMLASTAEELAQPLGASAMSGPWIAWQHRGYRVASGLIVRHSGGGQNLWFPATMPDMMADYAAAHAMAESALGMHTVLWRDVNGSLAGMQVSGPYSWIQGSVYQTPLSMSVRVDGVVAMAVVPRDNNAGVQRPALAAVLTQDGTATVSCQLVTLPGTGAALVAGIGPLPAAPADARWGVRMAVRGTDTAVLAWWYSRIEARGGVLVRSVGVTTGGLPVPQGAWVEAGALRFPAGPDILLTPSGPTALLPDPAYTGWLAVPVRSDGTAGAPYQVTSHSGGAIRAVAQEDGFLLFLTDSVMRVIELDTSARAHRAWVWDLGSAVQAPELLVEGRAVRLLAGNQQALWRPLGGEQVTLQGSDILFRFSGPAGLAGWIRHGDTPDDLPVYQQSAVLSGAEYPASTAGTLEFRWTPRPGEARRFFVFESFSLREIPP